MAYTTQKTLLERIRNGDEESWTNFYARYSRLIFSVGLRYRLSHDDCLELVQLVMLAVFRSRQTFRYQPELGKFRTYLTGIIRNVIRHMYRDQNIAQQRREELFLQTDIADDGEEAILQEEWHNYLLSVALSELHNQVEDTTFDAFQMYVLQERAPDEIARTLKISVNSVYVYKKRCLEHLRKNIAQLRENDPDFAL